MKLRQQSGHEMITVATRASVVEVKKWAELKFVWEPTQRKLTIYVNGVKEGSGIAQIQSGNTNLNNGNGGDWTWGKAESSNVGTLDADVRDFFFVRSAAPIEGE